VVVAELGRTSRREDSVARASLRASAKQSRAAYASGWIASSLALLAMTRLGGFRIDTLSAHREDGNPAPGPRLRGDDGIGLSTRYSPLAGPTCATVPEPDRPNEKDNSMSSGFSLKWASTERRTISARAANGFLS
jgi:hypothetical protein